MDAGGLPRRCAGIGRFTHQSHKLMGVSTDLHAAVAKAVAEGIDLAVHGPASDLIGDHERFLIIEDRFRTKIKGLTLLLQMAYCNKHSILLSLAPFQTDDELIVLENSGRIRSSEWILLCPRRTTWGAPKLIRLWELPTALFPNLPMSED
jgi:hypothetical protein